MNLALMGHKDFYKTSPASYQSTTDSYDLIEFRKVDYAKIDKHLQELWAQLKEFNNEFDYNIDHVELISAYSGIGQNFESQYIIQQRYREQANELKINIPKLVYDAYFVLGNSYYIPTFVLERLPIDKNHNKQRVFISLTNNITIALFYNKKLKQYMVSTPKNKKITLDLFASVVLADRPDRLELLKERKIIRKIYKYNSAIKEVSKAFGFYNYEFFKVEARFNDFLNYFYTLPYHRRLFKRIYNTELFEDIVWEAIKLLTNDDEKIDLSDLRNRRLVMSEYLLSPVFDLYYRMLNLLVDRTKTSQMVLPSMNQAVVLTTGFRGLLHAKQLYDISSPYSVTLMTKISQKISIVSENIPRAWTQLHDSHYRVIDPIAVSAANMGAVIAATRLATVDEHGLFNVKGNREAKHFELIEGDQ